MFDILGEGQQQIALEREGQGFSEDLDVLQEEGGAQRQPPVHCRTSEHSHCGTLTGSDRRHFFGSLVMDFESPGKDEVKSYVTGRDCRSWIHSTNPGFHKHFDQSSGSFITLPLC